MAELNHFYPDPVQIESESNTHKLKKYGTNHPRSRAALDKYEERLEGKRLAEEDIFDE